MAESRIVISGRCHGCGVRFERAEDHGNELDIVVVPILCEPCLQEWRDVSGREGGAGEGDAPTSGTSSARRQIQNQLEAAARQHFGMSAEEFGEHYDGGYWLDPLVIDPVLRVQALRQLLEWLE